jgi:hypothetical protein
LRRLSTADSVISAARGDYLGDWEMLDAFEQAPCDSCEFRERCATEHLACERFVSYYDGASHARWSKAPNIAPTRAKWAAIFERDLRSLERGPRPVRVSAKDLPPRRLVEPLR